MELELRPVDSGDTGFCYRVAADNNPAWIRVCASGLPTPPHFERVLWAGVYAMFAAAADGNPAGLTSLYSVDHRNGVGWVDVAMLGGLGHHPELNSAAAEWMVRYGFERCGLRKIYVSSPGWVAPLLDEGEGRCRTEAQLIDHLLHESVYWPLRIQAADRSEFL